MRILYRKFQPVDYVIVMKNGKRVKEGIGLTVLGNSMRIGLIVAPATAYDGTFAFDDLVTADYQSICVQGTLAVRGYAVNLLCQRKVLFAFHISVGIDKLMPGETTFHQSVGKKRFPRFLSG